VTVDFQLSENDLERIAEAVAAKLERPGKRWYTVDDASVYTGLTPEALRSASKKGRLVSSKGASGRLVFAREALDVFMGGE